MCLLSYPPGNSDSIFSWARRDQYHLTFALLTLIAGNATWKVAPGFDKGAVDGTCTQGKKLVEHHRSIAKELFLNDVSGLWTENSSLVKLGNAVKNRITSYVHHFLIFFRSMLTIYIA